MSDTSPMHQPVIVDRRADKAPGGCAPCSQLSEIAVIKDRDTRTEALLQKILETNENMAKDLSIIKTIEVQLMSHREDIERLYQSTTQITKEVGAVERRVTSWDDKIKAGWWVFGVVVTGSIGLLTIMANWVAGDIKTQYVDMLNTTRNQGLSIGNLEDQLTRMKIEAKGKK